MSAYETEDPTPDTKKLVNEFVFGESQVCPYSSHIRKTNLRQRFDTNFPDQKCSKVSMIRNGIPYGTDYKGHENDKSRGLLFACYQGNIEDGFQHMQSEWSNAPGFPEKDVGHDPIIGQVKQKVEGKEHVNGTLTTHFLGIDKKKTKVTFQQLVTMKGGEYFFVPPISALKGGVLATATPATK